MKENWISTLRSEERSTVRALCGIQLKDRKRANDLIKMMDLNETIDQLAMANSLHWQSRVVKREYDYVLGKAKV